jgi:uncharacterized membrane protein YoaK (UPF0700 family)/anti-anti-sigma regulatory factor
MLSAGAYSFRQQARLAISLSWIGGYVNVVILLLTAHTVSHTTGNSTSFAERMITGRWQELAVLGGILTCFLLGAIISASMTQGTRRRGARSNYILPVSTEALLLLVLAVLIELQTGGARKHGNLTVAMACLASMVMGLQNATITHISGSVVRTTHLTGVFTDLGIECVKLFLWWKDRIRSTDSRRASRLLRVIVRNGRFQRVALLASIIGSFGFGAMAGTWLYGHETSLVMYPPVLFLLWIIWLDWKRPIADVRMIDPLMDQDFQAAGLVRELLPPQIGIYRLFIHSNEHHRAPDFQKWASNLPAHWTVIVLMLSPMTSLDTNAALDLRLAVEALLDEGKQLILTGMTKPQRRTLMQAGLASVMSRENVCANLPISVNRALELLHRQQA